MSTPNLPPVTNGMVPATEVAEFLATSGITIEALMLALVPQAETFARPPISNFFVGAVSQGASGSLYFGANYEFVGQALSFTVHGEQAATAHAIASGEIGMQRLAVSAAPCGYCRQFLYELDTAATLQILCSLHLQLRRCRPQDSRWQPLHRIGGRERRLQSEYVSAGSRDRQPGDLWRKII